MDEVHEPTRNGQHEAHPVLPPSARPPGHLVEFGAGEGDELVAVEEVRIHQDDRPGGVIDACGDGGGGEDRPQVSLLHHRLHEEFPGGKLAAVVGRHAGRLECEELPVGPEVGKPVEQRRQFPGEGVVFLLLFFVCPAAHPQGRVAFGAGLEKEDRRQESKPREDLDHLAERRESPLGPAMMLSSRRSRRSCRRAGSPRPAASGVPRGGGRGG